jgi:Tfp pilus assembly protein PilN
MFFSAHKSIPQSSPIKNLLRTNLLNKKGDAIPLQVNLLKWLLSSGRFIVIFVEMIVIGAFVYRYKLDADLISLQEEITQQASYVQSLKSDEEIIRLTQFQLSSIREVKNSRIAYPPILSNVARLTPKNIRLTSINIQNDKTNKTTTLSISGNTPSNLELSAFIKALQSDPQFKDIALSNVSFEASTTFTVNGQIAGPTGGAN